MNSGVERESSSSERTRKASLNLNGPDDRIKCASYPTMNHRWNSAIHFVSAIYWALGTAVGFLFGPYPFSSTVGFRLWVSAGIGLIMVDLFAGINQWGSSTTGRVFSTVLHLAVTILIVAIMTFEYLQAHPKSFLVWFRAGDYSFVAVLALVRLGIGTALLLGNKDTH